MRANMTTEYGDLNDYLTVIGWSKAGLATRLQVSVRTVERWANGQNETPLAVLEWLDVVARVMVKLGLPQGWKPPALREAARA
jgi:transcriptional regulator with XRE-family HTH domain